MAKERRAKGPSQRQLRVGELIRHVLAEILLRGEISDPELEDLRLTISEVRVSPDIRHATVYVVCSDVPAQEAARRLARHRKFLRGQLGHRVDLKYLPDLAFQPDESLEASARIDEILRSPDVARDLD